MKGNKTDLTRHDHVGHQTKGNDAGIEYKESVVSNAPVGAGYEGEYGGSPVTYRPGRENYYAALGYIGSNADRYKDAKLREKYAEARDAYEREDYDVADAKIVACVLYIIRSYSKAA